MYWSRFFYRSSSQIYYAVQSICRAQGFSSVGIFALPFKLSEMNALTLIYFQHRETKVEGFTVS
jgi:hypothetical protein